MQILYLTGVPGALASVVRDLYIEAGWQVVGFGRSMDTYSHAAYRFIQMDATDEQSVSLAFEKAVECVGRPHVLIATVGGVRSWKPIAETSTDDFEALLRLNLLSLFLTSKHAMKILEDGGRLISIGAESAMHPSANRGAYVAAKAGVMSLTKVLAKEGRSRSVTANCIVPTVIRTAANEEWGSPEDIVKWTTPEDIARMCLFLCSDSGSSVNGSFIEMPGRM